LSGAHAGKLAPVSFSRKQLAAQPAAESLNFPKKQKSHQKTGFLPLKPNMRFSSKTL